MANQQMSITVQKLFTLLVILFFSYSVFSQARIRTMDYDEDRPEEVDSFRILHLMLAGNIYQSEYEIKHAFLPEQKNYVNPVLNLGDVVIANLKTGFTGDNTNPFSAPDEFALALKYSGINQCVIANLNTAYLEKKAMQRTRKALEIFDIQSTGAFADNITRNGNYPKLINRKGFKIVLLNYTSIAQRPSISRDYIINQIDHNLIERDMKIARSMEADFIIVYLDWGGNYQEYPAYSQEALSKFILEQGANLIVGTFPNTVQRIDIMSYYYQQKEKQGLVCYSLGNLISSSIEDRTKSGVIMDIDLKKNNFTGEVHIGDYGFIPVWTYFDTISDRKRTYVLPVASVEQAQLFGNLPADEKRKMLNHTMDIRKMLGRSSDEIQYNLSEIVVENVEASTTLTNAPLNNRFNPFDERGLNKSGSPTFKANIPVTEDTIYHVQFYELKVLIPIDTSYYDHLKGYEVMKEEGTYRYLIGNSTSLETISQLYYDVMKPRYKQCVVVAYHQGRRVRIVSMKDK